MKKKIVRLNKYIASCGVCSRRKADELIETGCVRVNNKVVQELGFLVEPKHKVSVNNELIYPKKFTYIRYYKPAGYITTFDDDKGRKTIYDLVPEEIRDLKPVGRLDKDSTGLLIMTNDGDLIHDLTHPSLRVAKVYRVVVSGKIAEHHLMEMAKGIEIEPNQTAYAESRVIEYDGKNTVLKIILHQGLNRQIRKMLDFLGFPVISLKRIQHGTIDLLGLKKGQFKYLKPKQIQELKNYVKKLHPQGGSLGAVRLSAKQKD